MNVLSDRVSVFWDKSLLSGITLLIGYWVCVELLFWAPWVLIGYFSLIGWFVYGVAVPLVLFKIWTGRFLPPYTGLWRTVFKTIMTLSWMGLMIGVSLYDTFWQFEDRSALYEGAFYNIVLFCLWQSHLFGKAAGTVRVIQWIVGMVFLLLGVFFYFSDLFFPVTD